MFHSILAAVDESPPSAGALAIAARVARHHGAELTVLTVLPAGGSWTLPASARLPERVTPSIRRDWGPAAPAILREADAGGHDLIVLGSRGRGALTATVLGSVARSVVSRSDVPVLVVKDGGAAAGAEHFVRILVAVDGSPESEVALALSAGLALSDGALLTLLTVTSVHRTVGMPESALVRLQSDHAERAQGLLDGAVASLPCGLTVDTRVGWGPVEASILAEVERGGHDLLLLGSRGRSLGRATLLGSTGLAMLRHCPVPVLIARSASGAAMDGRPAQLAGARSLRPAAGR